MLLRVVKRRNQGSARGFTLIEVLVSLVILSLLMLATVAAMRTFGKTQVAMEAVTQRADNIRLVSRFLRNSLEAMLPSNSGTVSALSTGGGPSDAGGAYFGGTASTLSWHAPMIFGESFGGTLALHLAKENNQLVLRWQAIEPGEPDYRWSTTESKVLLENVESFELEYRPEVEADWEESWQEGQSPPLAVRLSLRVEERYWPELVIAL